ncbi:MAG: DUF3836 domain-containing protein [Bacteroidales bacterium]|nr:DUF3836 domain-containing protein [Bacteroidales bacterium]
MKTTQLLKTAFVIILLGFFGLSSFAKINNNLIYDTEEVNGIMVAQTVYKQEDGMLAKHQKYTYDYDNNLRVIQSTSYKWENNTWVNDMCIKHEYQGKTVTTTYYKWNKNKKEYILQPNMTLITDYN